MRPVLAFCILWHFASQQAQERFVVESFQTSLASDPLLIEAITRVSTLALLTLHCMW